MIVVKDSLKLSKIVLESYLGVNSYLLPPSTVKSTGYSMVNVLKIAGYPTKCLQAPLGAFSSSVHGSILINLKRCIPNHTKYCRKY